ncbi:MAG: molybdopterin-dependent oxidoreductase [Nocardioides sp.]
MPKIVRTAKGAWASAGVLAGVAGLAVSHAVAAALSIREAPIVAATEGIIRVTPASLVENAISVFGTWDKTVLVGLVGAALVGFFVAAGLLARRSAAYPLAIFAALALIALASVLTARATVPATAALPIVAGFVTWVLALSLLTTPLRPPSADPSQMQAETSQTQADTSRKRRERFLTASVAGPDRASRRSFLYRLGAVAGATVAATGLGRWLGRDSGKVQQARAMLKLPITTPDLPEGARVDVDGIAPWRTPNDDFYLIHTAIAVPTITPTDYVLRIHGLVDQELTVTYRDLTAREFTEDWITLNCVSNVVGGDLVGNAWWSGVKISELLAEAGIQEGADAVLQTSADGWNCGTPLAALTDDRNAMLALGMNGEPLPVEHGFPVRMIVPGLYGYVSATKWLTDIEVTRFADIEAYWTSRGWAEEGPVKIASRIDVPENGGEVPAGEVRFGGSAWMQHTGIKTVEVSVDGAAWVVAELGAVPSTDTWVQWAATIDVPKGDHRVAVRATDVNGEVQTSVERDVIPDGATGWHSIPFTAV